MSFSSVPVSWSAGTDWMKASVLAMRPFRSARLCSLSSCLGASTPASRATQNRAPSQAIWICRLKGSMSGARRAARYTLVSNFLACAWASALSIHLTRLPSRRTNTGTLAEYMVMDMESPGVSVFLRASDATADGAQLPGPTWIPGRAHPDEHHHPRRLPGRGAQAQVRLAAGAPQRQGVHQHRQGHRPTLRAAARCRGVGADPRAHPVSAPVAGEAAQAQAAGADRPRGLAHR